MVRRAQASLIFSDKEAELYDNLVEPAKREKELKQILVQCLKVFYYDEEIRGKIQCARLVENEDDSSQKQFHIVYDGYEDDGAESEEQSFARDFVNSMRNGLNIMEELTSQASGVLSEGADILSAYVEDEDGNIDLDKTTDILKSRGLISVDTTSSDLHLNMEKLQPKSKKKKQEEDTKTLLREILLEELNYFIDSRVTSIVDRIDNARKTVSEQNEDTTNQENLSHTESDSVPVAKEEPKVEVAPPIQEPEKEEPTQVEVEDDTEIELSFLNSDTSTVEEDEDASDSMSGLLGSIF